MQSVTIHKNIGLMMFVLAVALFGALSVTSAHGQWRDRDDDWNRNNGRIYRSDRNDRWGRVSQKDLRKAYERGFKQGEKDGKRDARDGGYRNGGYGNRGYGTYGNNGRYGNGGYGGGQIQRAYADGYNRGYQEGYDRNYRNSRNRRYGSYGNRPSIFGIPLPY
jgi:hypothetical protein